MVFNVFAYDQYRDRRPGLHIGCGMTRDGARQIILDYRRFGVVGSQCDVVTAPRPTASAVAGARE